MMCIQCLQKLHEQCFSGKMKPTCQNSAILCTFKNGLKIKRTFLLAAFQLQSITTSPQFKCVIAKLVRLLHFLPEGAILFLWALSSGQFEKCSRITEVASNNFGFTFLISGEILVRKPLKPIEKTGTKQ